MTNGKQRSDIDNLKLCSWGSEKKEISLDQVFSQRIQLSDDCKVDFEEDKI